MPVIIVAADGCQWVQFAFVFALEQNELELIMVTS